MTEPGSINEKEQIFKSIEKVVSDYGAHNLSADDYQGKVKSLEALVDNIYADFASFIEKVKAYGRDSPSNEIRDYLQSYVEGAEERLQNIRLGFGRVFASMRNLTKCAINHYLGEALDSARITMEYVSELDAASLEAHRFVQMRED